MQRKLSGLVLVSAMLMACGSDETANAPGATDAAGAPSADLCELLQMLDLEGLLEEPVGEPIENSTEVGDHCLIESVSEESSGGISLTATYRLGARNFDTQQQLAGELAEDVEGIGDAAFRAGAAISILSGDVLFVLSIVRDSGVGGVSDADLEAAAAQVWTALDG